MNMIQKDCEIHGSMCRLRGGGVARHLAMLLVVVLLAAGCSDGRPKRVAVQGTVLYKGEPVEGAHVMFIPHGARPASARTDAQGRFVLHTFDPADGAVIGTHRITIAKMSADSDDPYAPKTSVLPDQYRRTDTSGLTAEVTLDGENDFLFELQD